MAVPTTMLPRALRAQSLRSTSLMSKPQTRAATTSQMPNSSPTPRRRSVTVSNDTGYVPWKDLSAGEKAARSTQQSFNFGVVLLGAGLTGAVAYILYMEVFSTDSKTAVFNKAADRIRKDSRCLDILAGTDGHHTKHEITAHGEPSWSRWARNRTIASRHETDRAGIEHTYLHFYVEGPKSHGTVHVHVARRPNEKEWEYRLLALDVAGHQRVELENKDASLFGSKQGMGKMFGVRWN
ncbi:hypothetical protein D0862_08735 [Hortaea werneckii]|uniref:Mitochondrial import inner membrane translocase subunit Tim21 n=1 Tax=Hortaea werneckii TaxID=91943 RepID=A0A3M7G4N5_HORWE|nr:hypothetical protein D0862_08735 [Hortaea werneckii]